MPPFQRPTQRALQIMSMKDWTVIADFNFLCVLLLRFICGSNLIALVYKEAFISTLTISLCFENAQPRNHCIALFCYNGNSSFWSVRYSFIWSNCILKWSFVFCWNILSIKRTMLLLIHTWNWKFDLLSAF